MKTLIKYLLIGFVCYLLWDNRGAVISWAKDDGKELATQAYKGAKDSTNELIDEIEDK